MIVMGLDATRHVVTCELSIEGNVKHHARVDAKSFVVDAPGLAASVLAQAGVRPSEVSLYAVNVGPGSWTGIRVGVTFIKTLALAANRPIVAVPAFSLVCATQPRNAKLMRVVIRLHGDKLLVVDMDNSRSLPWVDVAPAIMAESQLDVQADDGRTYIWYGPPPIARQLEQRATRIAAEDIPVGTLNRVAAQSYSEGKYAPPKDILPDYGLSFPSASNVGQ